MKKGSKHTPEVIAKLRESHKGAVAWNKGLSKNTDERVAKYARTLKERGIRPSFLGRKHSLETRLKISLLQTGRPTPWQRGDKSHRWKGGKTSQIMTLRNSLEYKIWRRGVFERDNYTCIWCEQRGGNLNADHIKPFALFPELRFALDNGTGIP